MATPPSKRVAPSAVIETGTSPKLPNWATAPTIAANQASPSSKRDLLIRSPEAILPTLAGKRKTPHSSDQFGTEQKHDFQRARARRAAEIQSAPCGRRTASFSTVH